MVVVFSKDSQKGSKNEKYKPACWVKSLDPEIDAGYRIS